MTAENIEVFTQSSIRITSGERRIYIDPFQMKEAPRDADFILITHDQFVRTDHLMACLQQSVDQMTADKPGTAGN